VAAALVDTAAVAGAPAALAVEAEVAAGVAPPARAALDAVAPVTLPVAMPQAASSGALSRRVALPQARSRARRETLALDPIMDRSFSPGLFLWGRFSICLFSRMAD
jgi:hypothetical protein